MWTDDDGRRQTPDHGYTISSPCEPEGSGEQIIALKHENENEPNSKTSQQQMMPLWHGQFGPQVHSWQDVQWGLLNIATHKT